MLKVIDRITPVKVAGATEEMGLDLGIHGEAAYLEEGI
jgi:ammonia channel protein AmtB